MSSLLVLQSSAAADHSRSRAVTAELLHHLAEIPGLRVVERDLATIPLPGLTTDAVVGMFRPPPDRTRAQHTALQLSELLIAELERADAVVISSPMYNYTVSAQLKAWIDQVVMPGRTFTYGPTGARGALVDRPTVVITASGGTYDAARAHEDFHVPYLRHILGFIGLFDVAFVQADGGIADPAGALARGRARLDEPGRRLRAHLMGATVAA